MPLFGLFGSPNISKLTDARNIDALIRALGHKGPLVRRQAALALAELGDYIGFSQVYWELDYKSWPLQLPGYHGGLWRYQHLFEPGELPIAIIGVSLALHQGDSSYIIPNPTVRQVLSSMGYVNTYENKSIYDPLDTNTPVRPLYLSISNHKVVLSDAVGQSVYMSYSISDLDRLEVAKIEDKSSIADPPGRHARVLLDAEFTNGGQLPLVALASPPIFSSMGPLWEDELSSWVLQFSHYLGLFKSGHDTILDDYANCMLTYGCGGARVTRALINTISDADVEVQTAAVDALEVLGGPGAAEALSQYHGH